jgi:very-short-patch-repair endonuclease
MEEEIKYTMHHNASYKLFEYAVENRKNQTEAEKVLWSALKNKKLGGFKFRRQHPLATYILDFYCHEAKLCVEIDGGYHQKKSQKEYDEIRTSLLEIEGGITVIRFSNEQVLTSFNSVTTQILENLVKQPKKVQDNTPKSP